MLTKIADKFDNLALWAQVTVLGLMLFIGITVVSGLITFIIVLFGPLALIWIVILASCFYAAYVMLEL